MYYVLGFKGSVDLLSAHRNFPLSVEESNSLRIAFQDCVSSNCRRFLQGGFYKLAVCHIGVC